MSIQTKDLPQILLFSLVMLLHGLLHAQEKSTPADFLSVSAGLLPIILAAPHGGRDPIPGLALRRGVGVPQFTTERDHNTAELAELVADKINDKMGARPFVVIARFERKYIDANRAESAAYEAAEAKAYYDAYHQAIAGAAEKIRRVWGGGLLLDIHGQGAEAGTIFRGTDQGRSVAALNARYGWSALTGPQSILGQLAAKGYRIEPFGAANDRERRYTGGYTTRTYGSQRGGLDAIQLEFGTDLRAKRNIARTAEDLAHAIAVFAKAYLPAAEIRPKETVINQP